MKATRNKEGVAFFSFSISHRKPLKMCFLITLPIAFFSPDTTFKDSRQQGSPASIPTTLLVTRRKSVGRDIEQRPNRHLRLVRIRRLSDLLSKVARTGSQPQRPTLVRRSFLLGYSSQISGMDFRVNSGGLRGQD